MSCVRLRRGSWGVDFRDALGKRHFRRCASEPEAGKILQAIEAERAPVRLPGFSDLTVGDYAVMWFQEVAARSKPKTVLRYRKEYSYHLESELAGRRLSDISRFELKQLLAQKIRDGVGPSMLTKVMQMLFASAFEDGMIARHPAKGFRRLFRIESRAGANVKAFTARELARVLEEARTEPIYAGLFRLMAYTGLRSGEARALRVGDVHAEERKLDVVRTFTQDELSDSPKTESSKRTVELPREIASELARAVSFRDLGAWLFRRDGEFLKQTSVGLAFKRICARAGLPLHFSPHCLRHTYASILIQQGAPIVFVQRQLGHASIKLTVDTYGRWLEMSEPKALDRLVDSTRRAGSRRVTKEPVTDDETDSDPWAKVLLFATGSAIGAELVSRTRSSKQSEDDDPHDSGDEVA